MVVTGLSLEVFSRLALGADRLRILESSAVRYLHSGCDPDAARVCNQRSIRFVVGLGYQSDLRFHSSCSIDTQRGLTRRCSEPGPRAPVAIVRPRGPGR